MNPLLLLLLGGGAVVLLRPKKQPEKVAGVAAKETTFKAVAQALTAKNVGGSVVKNLVSRGLIRDESMPVASCGGTAWWQIKCPTTAPAAGSPNGGGVKDIADEVTAEVYAQAQAQWNNMKQAAKCEAVNRLNDYAAERGQPQISIDCGSDVTFADVTQASVALGLAVKCGAVAAGTGGAGGLPCALGAVVWTIWGEDISDWLDDHVWENVKDGASATWDWTKENLNPVNWF